MTPSAQFSGLSAEITRLVEHAAGRIVGINNGTRWGASGIHWRPGVVVTAEEALPRDDDLSLTLPGGREVRASLAGRDPSTDVAVLRFESDGQPVAEVGAGVDLQVGNLVLAVGSREGAPLASLGIVGFAGPAWESRRGGRIDGYIRLDIDLSSGAEGGAVVDAGARVLGMAVFGPRRRVLAIPARTIERVIDPLLAKGRIPRGYLGAGLHRVALPSTSEPHAEKRRGLLVVSVDPAGPAAAAGLRVGDIVLAWNGTRLTRVRELLRVLGPESVGSTAELELMRGDAAASLRVTLGERSAA